MPETDFEVRPRSGEIDDGPVRYVIIPDGPAEGGDGFSTDSDDDFIDSDGNPRGAVWEGHSDGYLLDNPPERVYVTEECSMAYDGSEWFDSDRVEVVPDLHQHEFTIPESDSDSGTGADTIPVGSVERLSGDLLQTVADSLDADPESLDVMVLKQE